MAHDFERIFAVWDAEDVAEVDALGFFDTVVLGDRHVLRLAAAVKMHDFHIRGWNVRGPKSSDARRRHFLRMERGADEARVSRRKVSLAIGRLESLGWPGRAAAWTLRRRHGCLMRIAERRAVLRAVRFFWQPSAPFAFETTKSDHRWN